MCTVKILSLKYLVVRGIYSLFFVFLCVCCKTDEDYFNKNFKDLGKVVSLLNAKWKISKYNNTEYPYIIIKENSLQDHSDYFLDSKAKLFIDSTLNKELKFFFESTSFSEIHFYNESKIEFLLKRSSNVFRDIFTYYVYIETEVDKSVYVPTEKNNWYYKKVSISY